MKNRTVYQVKINDAIVKQTTNRKNAQRVFSRERALHGGKVKFFEIHKR